MFSKLAEEGSKLSAEVAAAATLSQGFAPKADDEKAELPAITLNQLLGRIKTVDFEEGTKE